MDMIHFFSDEEPAEQPPVDNEHVAEGSTPFTPAEIEANTPSEIPAHEFVPPHLAPPEETARPLLDMLGSPADFLAWAVAAADSFISLADLSAVRTVDSLRGLHELRIRDRLNIANSVLVLATNHGLMTGNGELVDYCHASAEKMRIVMKRLGL